MRFTAMTVVVLRFILGAVLIFAGESKIRHPNLLLVDIQQYRILNTRWSGLVAATLPYEELAVGVALLSGTLVTASFATSAVLLTIFSIAQGSVIYRHLELSCGCFPIGPPTLIGSFTLARTTVLLLLALVGLFLAWRQQTVVASERLTASAAES